MLDNETNNTPALVPCTCSGFLAASADVNNVFRGILELLWRKTQD